VSRSKKFYTTGDIAHELNIPEWRVGRVFTRKLVEEPERLGRARVIPADRVAEIKDALAKANYLREGPHDREDG
jgi:hypothetical protein